jgi:hypothetical protein
LLEKAARKRNRRSKVISLIAKNHAKLPVTGKLKTRIQKYANFDVIWPAQLML